MHKESHRDSLASDALLNNPGQWQRNHTMAQTSNGNGIFAAVAAASPTFCLRRFDKAALPANHAAWEFVHGTN